MLPAPSWSSPCPCPGPLPQLPAVLLSRAPRHIPTTHRTGSLQAGAAPSTDPGVQKEPWTSCPWPVPVGSGREGAVALCAGTVWGSGVAGTPSSTGPPRSWQCPAAAPVVPLAVALPAARAAAPASCAWVPQAALHGAPGPTPSPPLTLLCPAGSQCHIPCPGTSSPAGARLWGIPHCTKA